MAFNTLNLAEIYGASDRANALRNQQEYQQYQIQRQMRDDQRQDAVRGAYKVNPDGTLDRQVTYSNLYAVDPMSALELQGTLSKQDADAAKAGLDRTKEELEIASKRAQVGRDMIASATPQNWPLIVAEGQKMGMQWAQNAPAEYNPDWVRSSVTTADKFISQNTPDIKEIDLGGVKQFVDVNPITNPAIKGTKYDKTATIGEKESARHNLVSEGLTRTGQGITIRGQNMVDARAREANATGKAPSGFRWKEDGTLEAIPGGPGDKKANPTEGQGKAALYSTRAAEADAILNELGNDYSRIGVSANNSFASEIPGVGMAINALSSDNTQKADQAQRNFINAILRQESGAAISAGEFDNARKQYFPQPGDSDAKVKQKAENRRTAIEGLDTMAGPLGKSANRQNIIPRNEPMPNNNSLTVTAPNGKTYTFKSKVEANQFKKQAGIK
jgi:hypothetical protein